MNKTTNTLRYLVIYGLPLLIIGLMIAVVKSPIFKGSPDYIATGVTLDLVLTSPLIYFLLIRKTNIPKITVVSMIVLGIVISSFLIPSENQYTLNLFKTWAIPVIEITVLSYVLYNVRKAIKKFNLNKKNNLDFYTVLKNTCYELFPKKIVIPIVTEISVIYYGFIYWKKRKLNDYEFSYHKDSGTVGLLIALIFIIAIETVTLHMLLMKWSYIAAWILTFLSIYSGFQIFGFLKSITKRPIAIQNNTLYLRYGIMSEATIHLDKIAMIEISSKELDPDSQIKKLSLLGSLEGHNVIIQLHTEETLNGLYGITKKFKELALFVDNKIAFKKYLEDRIKTNNA